MTIALFQILQDNTDIFFTAIRANMAATGTDATGKTSKSLRYEIHEGSGRIILEVFGRPYFATVETGRKPTPDKKPSREMIENISDWVNARGKDQDSIWAIATKINKEGSLLWQKGGRTDIFTSEKQPFVDSIFQEVTENLADEMFKNATVSFQ